MHVKNRFNKFKGFFFIKYQIIFYIIVSGWSLNTTVHRNVSTYIHLNRVISRLVFFTWATLLSYIIFASGNTKDDAYA